MRISADGLVRISIEEMLEVPLLHLCSALDADPPDCLSRCGTQLDWCGYTEWVSVDAPRITIGWDWRLAPARGGTSFQQDGPLRTNVMVIDGDNVDTGWDANLRLLSTVVNALDWPLVVTRVLEAQYRHQWTDVPCPEGQVGIVLPADAIIDADLARDIGKGRS